MTTLTNLQVNLGACARSIPLTSLTSPDDIAKISTAWSGPATGHAITIDAATFRVDLTILIPAAAACPAEVLGHHLDAIEALVNVLQGDKDKRGLSVDNLWRLGGMKHGLALSSWCVEVMGKWMGAFVGRLKKVGTWLDGAILAARKRVLEHVFADAEGALRRWTARLAHHPCTNMVCNTNRLAALNAFLVACGLCPRREVTKSLAEIISALELITSADADAVDGKLA
ncbi:hypothetical protein C8A03DRAFT_16106 [Achaetomium macrosporum]|uniref:Uncharacterized protein n=1 Tax=Achaetomium macrosporum TaxID=79813 RepID=A0AAN7C8I6_9PEZI|nr:hypothetical protein C8A03DRAFT_16106 [Achaetomium macrosporum]